MNTIKSYKFEIHFIISNKKCVESNLKVMMGEKGLNTTVEVLKIKYMEKIDLKIVLKVG